MKRIDEETLGILSKVTVTGNSNSIYLTCGQLDRKQYQAVNTVLESMGGTWDRKSKSHVFKSNPTDKLEQVLLSGEVIQPKKYGYFPTPHVVAQELLSHAKIEPGMMVLEPSAGEGALIDVLPACKVQAIELLDDNVAMLRSKYKEYVTIVQQDFMTITPFQIYDRVFMNPPFEKQQDIDHVLHAFKFLKEDGILAAIMSSSVLFRENSKTVNFRAVVAKCGYSVRLPECSFKESGTNVNTCIVVLNKNRE